MVRAEHSAIFNNHYNIRSNELVKQNDFNRKMAQKRIESEIRVGEANNNLNFQTSLPKCDTLSDSDADRILKATPDTSAESC